MACHACCWRNSDLTTHRVTFHAVLPPPALLEKSASSAGGLIIKGGPAFVHRKGVLRTNTRLWLELSVEMICEWRPPLRFTVPPFAADLVLTIRVTLIRHLPQLIPERTCTPFEDVPS